MSHYSSEQWKEYLQSPHSFTTMEEHLFTCDECLEKYLDISTSQEDHIFHNDDFTVSIMSSVSKLDLYKKEQKKPKWYETTIFHYTLAASITVLLVSGGFFQSIIGWADSMEGKPSFTEKIMKDMYETKEVLELEEENN